MFLIVGLGNPEEEYSNTRHNMGFDAINQISKDYRIEVNKKGFKGIYGTGIIDNKKVVLLKPQTYMNLSGESVIETINFYKINLDELVIIYDDIDVEPGNIKIRKKGGAGSHNGMKSVISSLNSDKFIRIRIGIGMPKYKNDMINYVTGKNITKDERNMLDVGIKKASNAVTAIIENGIDIAMNKFN